MSGGHGGQRAVDQWMQGHPISHAPDIILHDYDGPHSFVLIDIKTLDATAPTHVAAHHTDRARLSAHLAIAADSRRDQYRDIAPNMRLVIIAISTCGAINSEGIDFISQLAKRNDNSIPPALLDQASWAAPRLAPMVRMALGFAVRRGLAAAVYHWWRRSHALVRRPPVLPSPMLILLPPPSLAAPASTLHRHRPGAPSSMMTSPTRLSYLPIPMNHELLMSPLATCLYVCVVFVCPPRSTHQPGEVVARVQTRG